MFTLSLPLIVSNNNCLLFLVNFILTLFPGAVQDEASQKGTGTSSPSRSFTAPLASGSSYKCTRSVHIKIKYTGFWLNWHKC